MGKKLFQLKMADFQQTTIPTTNLAERISISYVTFKSCFCSLFSLPLSRPERHSLYKKGAETPKGWSGKADKHPLLHFASRAFKDNWGLYSSTPAYICYDSSRTHTQTFSYVEEKHAVCSGGGGPKRALVTSVLELVQSVSLELSLRVSFNRWSVQSWKSSQGNQETGKKL